MSTDVIMVTGAARGIGRSIAERLAETRPAPGVLVLADRDADALAATARTLTGLHPQTHVETIAFDVSDPVAVDDAFARIDERFGPLTRLAHAAGVLSTGPAVDASVEEWDRVFSTNARGTFLVTSNAARRLRASDHADRSIVVVASNAAGVPRASMGVYAASKAAAAAFVRCLGLELAPHGIRCNTVCPGSTDTDMQRAFWGEEQEKGLRSVIEGDPASFRVGIPLGRIADPRDIAEAVAFLLSPAAKHITMQDLYVDGGATLRG